MAPQLRRDNDTWDLATGVGATATMVAAARAVASNTDDPLIDDAFAESLVRAVGVDFFTRWAGGELDLADDDASRRVLQWFVDLMAVRTRYFDEFLLTAMAAGIRQAVILASGLDARGYRMAWPPGTTVFEIDQPQVIEFKTAALAQLNAQPTADLRMVPIDLRQDWPAALRRAGFDPSRPTAWVAEGLLPFLPPDAQDRLLDDITALSAADSRLATENFVPLTREALQPVLHRWGDDGFNVVPADLVYDGERNDVGMYLNNVGWQSASTPLSQLLADHGIAPGQDRSPFADSCYYSSIRSDRST
ncbi:class I SAM-dependent methyltransferase [Mycobacterium sp. SM1]|uniref:class I SAM-dependent methyltransferase n=1 Tax=Mycobacterium sp. SM1 TaxID=2816243 RepID=UPI001BCF2BF0|nr:class I SAM-dependent methyltransferase [Mycobacterium sp. SM1]MBS4729516.1 class I SAM-dependent methyltransferase [Mycobacterium sp. SM1]